VHNKRIGQRDDKRPEFTASQRNPSIAKLNIRNFIRFHYHHLNEHRSNTLGILNGINELHVTTNSVEFKAEQF